MARPRADVRALLADLPHRGEALEQQRANLVQFVADNAKEFAAMPYEPWTQIPAKLGVDGLKFEVRASGLPGLRGVFPCQPVPAFSQERRLLVYPGLLTTESLYRRFYEQYHCPTGLGLPLLKYLDDAGRDVDVTIIGDPTSAGAIINDGRYGRSDDSLNCALKSCKKELISRVLTKVASGKQRVSAEVACVWSLIDTPLQTTDELLCDYGSSFWQEEKDYCICCFKRDADDPRNPFVACEGVDEKPCSIVRHRLCFRKPPTLSELEASSNVHFYCPDHLAQLAMPVAAPQTVDSILIAPRRRHKEPQFTPPPARARAQSPQPVAAAASSSSAPASAGLSLHAPAHAPPRARRREPTFSPDPLFRSTASAHAPRPSALRSISFDSPSTSVKPDTESSFYSLPPRDRQRIFGRARRGSDESDFASEHSDSEIDMTGSGAEAHSGDSGEEEEEEAEEENEEEEEGLPACHRSLGRRTAATVCDDDSVSVAASVALLSARAKGASAERAPLTIRTPEQAKKLPEYALHRSLLTNEMWARCTQEISKEFKSIIDLQKSKERPWFVTEKEYYSLFPRKRRAPSPTRSVASAGPLVRSNSIVSVMSAPVIRREIRDDDPMPMDIDGEEPRSKPAAAAAAVVPPKSQPTSNRWLEREALALDFAEYRSCCGKEDKWIPQLEAALLSHRAVLEHCSHSAPAFLKSRIKHRSTYATKESFDAAIARDLLHGKPLWFGYSVCCSCFRAALGVGRDLIFKVTKQLTGNALAPQLTRSGQLKKQRKATQRDRAVNLLRSFCLARGQVEPNPTAKDPERKRYIVPQKQMNEFVQALLLFDKEQRKRADIDPLHPSSIYRGMAYLDVVEKLNISLGKGNSLCRCSVCDMLDNKCTPAYLTEHKLSDKDARRFQAQKLSHLAQMQTQRDYFDFHKLRAMQQPLQEWCVTWDGMDQSKTQLPSRARFSKELEPLTRLKLHWIGAFCFGGPDPVLGLMNTPELRKDAALSVVTLERILDIQWEALEKLHREKEHRVAISSQVASRAAPSRPASQAAVEPPAVERKEEPAQAAAEAAAEALEVLPDYASTLDSSAASYSGPGMGWPRRLHVTFDNASGECKNQWMMRFLGLLVKHGVFEAITASMLLVGHTHDIVDQMFSVWARMLRIHNAETFEKMRALFRDNYHTKIDGLVALMRSRQEAYAALGEAEFNKLDEDEREAFQEEMKEAAVDWNEEQAAILADFSKFVRDHNLLSPNIVHQTVTVDIEGWLCKAVSAKQPPALKGIPRAYNFGVERDNAGNVYLFNSQFADSAGRTTGPAIHNYPGQITGDYSTRALLYLADDPGLRTDPYRNPPLKINQLTELAETGRKYVDAYAMNLEELRDFKEMLNRLQQGQDKQEADCKHCYDALTSFGQHGVVSQSKGASKEERKEANRKISARAKSWTAMQTHLRDPKFAAVHDAKMLHTGFWTKWLQRKRDHIEPARIEHGWIYDPAVIAEPYHPPETELCSGVGEPPVHSDRAARVDLKRLNNSGTPVEGQVAIMRTATSREPFHVVKILGVRARPGSKRSQPLPAENSEPAAAAAAAEQSAQPAAAAAAAAAATGAEERSQHARLSMPRLKDLEYEVMYYDICPEDFAEKHLSAADDSEAKKQADTQWWSEQFEQHEQKEEDLVAAIQLATRGKPAPPRPGWLVDLYSDAKFLFEEAKKPKKGKQQQKTYWISGATLIVWDLPGDLLKSSAKSGNHPTWQLRKPVFTDVREDLTECKQDGAVGGNPASSSKAASKKRRRESQEDDESYEDEAFAEDTSPQPRTGAAAHHSSIRLNLSRAARARAPIVDGEDEEVEEAEEEDEAEEEEEDLEEEEEAEPAAAAMAPQKRSRNGKQTNKPAAAAAASSSSSHDEDDALPVVLLLQRQAEQTARTNKLAAAAAAAAAAPARDKKARGSATKRNKKR